MQNEQSDQETKAIVVYTPEEKVCMSLIKRKSLNESA